MGVLYVLDEPSIGLHPRDNARLTNTLKKLRDLGNSILVVEHDRETIESADFVVDLGPGAGEHGGEVVFSGTPGQLAKCKKSITGKYLQGKREIRIPKMRRKGLEKSLYLNGAGGNNLKKINIDFPLGKFVLITGVSGSGKSTLVNETLYPLLAQKLHGAKKYPLKFDSIDGIEHIEKAVEINQKPIGRTPRSNPATYTGVFTYIRELFSQISESRIRGYKVGRFSFNVKGGRCEACQGDGIIKIEMNFMPNVYVMCEVCNGLRYNRETLEIKYKGKTIADVLSMSVEDARKFFTNIPIIKRKLDTLLDVGLGYIRLGQQATTLSGGEAQRIKIASHLSSLSSGRILYILDEPTTGLHFDDIAKLLAALGKLLESGHTLLVVEHNLDVIKTADHVIDLGPKGGQEGGQVVATGTPEDLVKIVESKTGSVLKEVLASGRQNTYASQ